MTNKEETRSKRGTCPRSQLAKQLTPTHIIREINPIHDVGHGHRHSEPEETSDFLGPMLEGAMAGTWPREAIKNVDRRLNTRTQASISV